jgi:Ca2+-binding RTX toxin-like protein
MFKIGINSAPRIAKPPEVTEPQESSVPENLEQQSLPETKSKMINGGPMQAEGMMSSLAFRHQLNQQLANQTFARNRESVNSESLQNLEQIDRQAPLTEQEVEQQISYQPSVVKPFSPEEASIGLKLPEFLYTGSGDDIVEISEEGDSVRVTVNGKEAWKGTRERFANLTIDTGDGKDIVTINASGANVATGSGNDQVLLAASNSQVDTGEGNDEVYVAPGMYGGKNSVSTGEGSDLVYVSGKENYVNAGSGDDAVFIRDGRNRVDAGEGDDYIEIEGVANKVRTGDGEDQVKNKGIFTVVDGRGPFGNDDSF